MPSLSHTFGHLRRYRQVARILTRYGFGYFVAQLGIGRAIVPRLEKLRFTPTQILSATPAERVRMVIEELGPTFIKLGQILSTRSDLLPAEIVRELEKLQDTVPPAPFPLIQAQVERELKRPLADLFPNFDPEPVASASLGQVHFATLEGGEQVAVKVLRPGVERVVEVDLDILLELAALAQRRTEWGEYYDVVSLAEEFAATLRSEQNYELEAHNMERFRQIFAEEDSVRVPKVYHDTTTRRVLTMERIEGIKITNVAALRAAGLSCTEVASRNIHILLKSVLNEGFFHADPHPGNFVVMPDQVIGVMDFGIMGHLDPGERLLLVRLFVALFQGETERAVAAMSDLGIASRSADRRKLTQELDDLRARYFGLELEKLGARTFVDELMGIAFAHRLRMPRDLVLVFKTIAMLEGISLQLDPKFNVFTEVQPYVRDAVLELQSPLHRAREMADQLREATQAVLMLPQKVQSMLEQVASGEGNLSLRVKGLDEPTRRLSGAANRLTLAILAAAFVVGSALIIPYVQQIWPQGKGASLLLFVGGFVLSLLITLALVLSVWRSSR